MKKIRITVLIVILSFLTISTMQAYASAATQATQTLNSSGIITYPSSPPTTPTNFFGWSGYPRTLSGTYTTAMIDQVIDTMDRNNLNIYRMAFNDFRDINLYIPLVQYFLDNCDYILIADYYHGYPCATLTESQFYDEVLPKGLAIAEACNNDPNLYLEPWNERSNGEIIGGSAGHLAGDRELAGFAQTFIDELRSRGYVYGVVADRWWDEAAGWEVWADVYDPLDKFYTGDHYYFDSPYGTSQETRMQAALDAGCKIINTEIGADADEIKEFTQEKVDRVNEFLAWCASHGVNNVVWMRYGEENLPTYISMGLRNPLTGNLIY